MCLPGFLTAVPRNGIVIGYTLKVRTSKLSPCEHSSLGDLFVHLEGTEDVGKKSKKVRPRDGSLMQVTSTAPSQSSPKHLLSPHLS